MSAYRFPTELVFGLVAPGLLTELLIEEPAMLPEALIHRRGGRWVAEIFFAEQGGRSKVVPLNRRAAAAERPRAA